MAKHTKKQPTRRVPQFAQRVERALELPVGAITGAARIEVSDNKRAVVEGCKGILEYDENVIRLNTGGGFVRFTGSNLCVSCLTENSAVVTGIIAAVEFLY